MAWKVPQFILARLQQLFQKAFLYLTWRVVVKDYPKNAVVYLMCVKISAVMLMEAACFFPFMIKEESVLKS